MLKPSIPQPFIPGDVSLLPAGLPARLSMATRTVYVLKPEGEKQYLIFKEGFNAENDPQLNHVLGSGFTLQSACASAINAYELLLKQPVDFWPRLAGCTFTQRVEDGNVALQHCCVTAAGEELSHADTREEASRLALHRVLVDCSDMSFEEFRAISVPALLQPGGSRTHGTLFGDDQGQASVRKMVLNGFRQNPAYRQAAYAELEKSPLAPEPPHATGRRPPRDRLCILAEKLREKDAFNALVQTVYKEVLSTGFTAFQLVSPDRRWAANIITHPEGMSGDQALRGAYAAYVQAGQQRQAWQDHNAETVLPDEPACAPG